MKQLARLIGVAVSTLSDIKTGRTNEPKGMAAVWLFELAGPAADADGCAAAVDQQAGVTGASTKRGGR